MKLHEAITQARKAAGLSGRQLAQKANIRAATISDIETAKIDPRLSTLERIAEGLQLKIELKPK